MNITTTTIATCIQRQTHRNEIWIRLVNKFVSWRYMKLKWRVKKKWIMMWNINVVSKKKKNGYTDVTLTHLLHAKVKKKQRKKKFIKKKKKTKLVSQTDTDAIRCEYSIDVTETRSRTDFNSFISLLAS